MPSLMAVFLIFLGLSDFGLWEPYEINLVNLGASLSEDRACPSPQNDEDGDCVSDGKDKCPMEPETLNGAFDRDGCPDDPPGTGFLLDERLAALGWKIGGPSDLWARLPIALLGLLSVLALQLTLMPLAGRKISLIAAFVFASSPVLLFHGRQVTGHGVLMFAETLAICGLFLAAYADHLKGALAGWALAIIGLVTGWFSMGLLIGVVLPCATVLVATGLNGDIRNIFNAETPLPRGRKVLMLVLAVISVTSIGAFLLVALSNSADVPLISGGMADKPPKSIDATGSLQRLAYGWFPWSALAPAILFGLVGARSKDDPRFHLKALVVSGLTVGIILHALYHSLHGGTPVFLVLPMSLAAALVLSDLEESENPRRLVGLFVIMIGAVMLRDFAQKPGTLLMGYGLGKIKTPESFAPVVQLALASIPFAMLVISATFWGRGSSEKSGLRAVRARVILPLAAAALGAYFTAVLVPGLSINLSSKHVLESYERYANSGEPLGVMGSTQLSVESTRLNRRDDVLDWLNRKERVFALIPPKELARLDRDYRRKNAKHIFILDSKSEKYMLATNKPEPKAVNRNPIVEFVKSTPFKPGPKNKKKINFDNKLALRGWDVISSTGARKFEAGKEFTLTTYWKCLDSIPKNYKMFVHIDGPGPRIHGDHAPVRGTYPTNHWEAGDYIKDVYKGTVATYQESGKYRINIGFYKGNSRLPVVDQPKVKENSVRLGRVELK